MATQAMAAQTWFDGPRGGRSGFSSADEIAQRNQSLFQQQQRARRGPTPEVFFAKHLDNTRLVKAADPVRVKEMRRFAISMTVLFAMVMLYGWQHFSSIEIGYRVESEKQQLLQLQEQNRQLGLNQAQLCDLNRLDREARRLGMDAPHPGQVVRPENGLDMDLGPGAPVMAQVRMQQ
jgi:cell division protein FtsL